MAKKINKNLKIKDETMARRKTQELTIPESIYSLEPVGTIKGKDVYKDNPFVTPSSGFVVQVRQDVALIAKGLSITDTDSDEVSAGVIGKIQYVDKEEFVKLYTKNVGVLFDLNLTAQKALIAVFYAVQVQAKDTAHIFLSYQKSVEYYTTLGFEKIPTKASFSNGMRSLIKMGFLAAHYNGDGWYWFNPNLIFNGDRVRFVKEYKIKRKEQKQLQQSNLLDIK